MPHRIAGRKLSRTHDHRMAMLGNLAVSSVQSHDLPMVQGVVVYFVIIVAIVNLFIDLLYGWLNPKARLR